MNLSTPISGWEYCPIRIVTQEWRQRKCGAMSPYREGLWRRCSRDPQTIFICYECPWHGKWYLPVTRLEMQGEQHV